MPQDMEIKIESYANYPIYISITPDKFGKLFSGFSDEEQVECLKAMFRYMSDHPIQWDYVSMQLDRPENEEIKRKLKDRFGGE